MITLLVFTIKANFFDLSEVTAAIEAGLFDKPSASPTPTPTQAQTEGATYSTEKNNVSDKEDIDEVSDS